MEHHLELENGKERKSLCSIGLSLLIFGGEDVTVMSSATVKDLKLVVKKKVSDTEQSKMGHRYISWKHVWANYYLSHHNEKLLDDGSVLQNFGIRNNSQGIIVQLGQQKVKYAVEFSSDATSDWCHTLLIEFVTK